MPIILPDFKGRGCLDVCFCGFAEAKEDGSDAAIPEITRMQVARYKKAGKEVVVGMVRPFPMHKERVHVHLNFALPVKFGKEPPEVNTKADEILKRLEPLRGREVKYVIKGTYQIPQASLPAFIRTTNVESFADGIQVSLTGGKMSVKGAPIHAIAWDVSGKAGKAEVTLEAKATLPLEGNCFNEGMDLLEAAFKAFIIGEKNDA